MSYYTFIKKLEEDGKSPAEIKNALIQAIEYGYELYKKNAKESNIRLRAAFNTGFTHVYHIGPYILYGNLHCRG